MLTSGQIRRDERLINAKQQRVNETFARRARGTSAQSEWAAACREFHKLETSFDFLWSREARDQIRRGNREFIEDAILFLEVDPWFFRSGYLKEWLLDTLKQAQLTDLDKSRIRLVILRAALGRNRREFRRFCKLAVRVADEDFVREIEQQAALHNAESEGKLSYLLKYIREHMFRSQVDK